MSTELVNCELLELETIIENGLKTFVDVGLALMKIKEKKLYRQEYGTFEEYCKSRWSISRSYGWRLIESAKVIENLLPTGNILPINEKQVRHLSGLTPEKQVEVWQGLLKTHGDPDSITEEDVKGAIGKPHVINNSGDDEWYTPRDIIEAARSVLGEIDLDPASCDVANKTVKAKKYYTICDDGLTKEWKGRVWMNPPYSTGKISLFIEKLFESEDVTEAIILVNNATETKWFGLFFKNATKICFPSSRIRFLKDNSELGSPLQGNAIIYFGNNGDKFSTIFKPFGTIVMVEK